MNAPTPETDACTMKVCLNWFGRGDTVREIVFADKCQTMERQRDALAALASRKALTAKLKDWLIDHYGDPLDNMTEERKDKWCRDLGLIYSFIHDHFPEEATDDG